MSAPNRLPAPKNFGWAAYSRLRFSQHASQRQCPLYPQKRTLIEHVGMSALCQKRTSARETAVVQVALCLVVLARRPDLRCAYRLCHPVKDDYALAAAARRQRLLSVGEAAVDVLPVVHYPHVARGRDGEISLHL